jgi:hypothetical protein
VLPEPWFERSVLAGDELPRRLPTLPDSRLAMPALGRSIVPDAPRAESAPFERPPAGIPPTWLCAIDCRRLEVSCLNEAGREMLLCDPKKLDAPPLRTVDGEAARPLADRLARDGTTGKLPAIMRAPPTCSRDAAAAVTRPAPKWAAFTTESAPPMCAL